MDERIVEADAVKDAAYKQWQRVVEAVQAECQHPTAYEEPGYENWLGWHPSQRVCVTCGLYEAPEYGTFHKIGKAFTKPVPGGTSIFKHARRCF